MAGQPRRRRRQGKWDLTDDDREGYVEWVAQLGVPSAVQKVLLQLIDTEVLVEGFCEACGGRSKVRYPNYMGQATALKMVFEYKLQKPEHRSQVTHRVELVRAELDAMSVEELLEVEEAAWKELPSPG